MNCKNVKSFRKTPGKASVIISVLLLAALLLTACAKQDSSTGNVSDVASAPQTTASPAAESMPDGMEEKSPRAEEDRLEYTLSEYLAAAPRIMIIAKPRDISKGHTVEKLYVIADGKVAEKKTIPPEDVLSEEEASKLTEEQLQARRIIQNGKKMTLGEICRMTETELSDYIAGLETISEAPLSLHAYTDKSGNCVIGEDINGLVIGNRVEGARGMEPMWFQVYSKYLTGIALVEPREYYGFFFLSDTQDTIFMDSTAVPGIQVD